MTEGTVVQFPGTPPPVEPPPPEPGWGEKFMEDEYPHFCYLVDHLGWAENEEEMRARMSVIRATVSTWRI